MTECHMLAEVLKSVAIGAGIGLFISNVVLILLFQKLIEEEDDD